MAWHYTTNQTPASPGAWLYQFKQNLVAAGWVIKSSSDGTTYNSSGDQISSGGTGAGGFDRAHAWVRAQDPGGVQEITIQLGASGGKTAQIKYSASAKFTGGSPNATTTPTATDSVNIVGSSDTSNNLFLGTNGNQVFDCGAEDVTPYPFYSVSYPSGGGAINHFLFMDALQVGSYDSGDTNPVVWGWTATGADIFTANNTGYLFAVASNAVGNPGVVAWAKFGLSGATFQPMGVAQICVGTNPIFPGGLPANLYNSKDEFSIIPVGRSTQSVAPNTFKGVLRSMRWLGTQKSNSRDTASLLATDDYMIIQASWAVPWPNITPL